MDWVRLRLLFDCHLEVDDNSLPLPDIVLVGSSVGSDDLIAESSKVDVVLGMIEDMDNAQIVMPLHHSCLSFVLFSSTFRSTPPE
jgi:hypothetical protein